MVRGLSLFTYARHPILLWGATLFVAGVTVAVALDPPEGLDGLDLLSMGALFSFFWSCIAAMHWTHWRLRRDPEWAPPSWFGEDDLAPRG